jgi:hypothetical protein
VVDDEIAYVEVLYRPRWTNVIHRSGQTTRRVSPNASPRMTVRPGALINARSAV